MLLGGLKLYAFLGVLFNETRVLFICNATRYPDFFLVTFLTKQLRLFNICKCKDPNNLFTFVWIIFSRLINITPERNMVITDEFRYGKMLLFSAYEKNSVFVSNKRVFYCYITSS